MKEQESSKALVAELREHRRKIKASPASSGSADYVRIWSVEDVGPEVHLISPGNDYTICGHDIAGDDMVHKKEPEELKGRHRVTCPLCLNIIKAVRAHIGKPNPKFSGA